MATERRDTAAKKSEETHLETGGVHGLEEAAVLVLGGLQLALCLCVPPAPEARLRLTPPPSPRRLNGATERATPSQRSRLRLGLRRVAPRPQPCCVGRHSVIRVGAR